MPKLYTGINEKGMGSPANPCLHDVNTTHTEVLSSLPPPPHFSRSGKLIKASCSFFTILTYIFFLKYLLLLFVETALSSAPKYTFSRASSNEYVSFLFLVPEELMCSITQASLMQLVSNLRVTSRLKQKIASFTSSYTFVVASEGHVCVPQ